MESNKGDANPIRPKNDCKDETYKYNTKYTTTV